MSAATAIRIKGMDICAYLTGDPQRSIAFYRDVLGMTPTDIDEQGRGAEFTLADGSTFGVWKPEGDATGGGFMMFAVDDAKAAVAELRTKGLQITDVEETPVCFMAFAQDPDGNGFAIHQRK
jgi:predicted enzyme related to lactoylglutathione lyase